MIVVLVNGSGDGDIAFRFLDEPATRDNCLRSCVFFLANPSIVASSVFPFYFKKVFEGEDVSHTCYFAAFIAFAKGLPLEVGLPLFFLPLLDFVSSLSAGFFLVKAMCFILDQI